MSVQGLNRNVELCHGLYRKIFDEEMFLYKNVEKEDYVFRMTINLLDKLSMYLKFDTQEIKSVNEYINILNSNDNINLNFNVSELRNEVVKLKEKYKQEAEISFISECEPLIIYPMRVIYEKIYRELNKKNFDESLNEFLDKNK